MSAIASDDVNDVIAWSLAEAAAGRIDTPRQLENAALQWHDAPVPGTVAQALTAAGKWDFESRMDLDASDWWYRGSFTHVPPHSPVQSLLRFEGLATLADVWLNGELILSADNMFRAYTVDVTGRLDDRNELIVCFRSLTAALARRRPRPRWKTKLVSHQQLRWFRTTLLGRIPGWSPPVAPVGPWRAVTLEHRHQGSISDVDVRTSLDGRTGVVEVSCWIARERDADISATVRVGDASAVLRVEREGPGYRLSGQVRVDDAQLWWPHTHGTPQLYPCSIRVVIEGLVTVREYGRVGFRQLELRQREGGFAVAVNGTPVFCRGACWTVNDIVSLTGSASDRLRSLNLLRQAGANMIRVGGTMIYEDDAFYGACDELGILVWQDFMFANMDYPAEDAGFLTSVRAEATEQLRRLRTHPSVAVYCGNSEIEQQAAMLGMPRTFWRNTLFADVLPALCAQWHPGTAYVPSTPTGGALPFHVGTGLTHYYGVGAYLRPVSDVRRATVRFTTECLGFANVPDNDVVDLVMAGDSPATHDPRWKRRTPRDTGAGWDFEDVRDHYLQQVFATKPALRWSDPVRYLELSRVITGELMSQVFSEWRSSFSGCGGGLVWFFKDFWPGAGWGILDSRGIPKACFYFLQRAWQPQAVVLTDEGLDGVHAHVINEVDRPLSAILELTLLRDGHVVIAETQTRCDLEPRATATYAFDALLDAFYDVSYAYRFGPATHDVAAAVLRDEAGQIISEAFWFPAGAASVRPAAHGISAEARALDDRSYTVTVRSERFLSAAHVDAKGFLPDDNYFCLMPGRARQVRLRPLSNEPIRFSAYLEALNLDSAWPVNLPNPPGAQP